MNRASKTKQRVSEHGRHGKEHRFNFKTTSQKAGGVGNKKLRCPQHGKIQIQPLVDVSSEQLIHSGQVMLHMVFLKGVVIGQAIYELDVNGRIIGLHQFQINQQSFGAAIAINIG